MQQFSRDERHIGVIRECVCDIELLFIDLHQMFLTFNSIVLLVQYCLHPYKNLVVICSQPGTKVRNKRSLNVKKCTIFVVDFLWKFALDLNNKIIIYKIIRQALRILRNIHYPCLHSTYSARKYLSNTLFDKGGGS